MLSGQTAANLWPHEQVCFMTEQVVQQRVHLEKCLLPILRFRDHTKACCICRPRIQLSRETSLPHF